MRLVLGRRTIPPIGHIRYLWNHPQFAQAHEGPRPSAIAVHQTNSWVNKSIKGQPEEHDDWHLWPRIGDCEDYALTKQAELWKLGVGTAYLLLAITELPILGKHAVLVARCTDRDLIMDNMRIDPYPVGSDTTWVKAQSPDNPKHWLICHG